MACLRPIRVGHLEPGRFCHLYYPSYVTPNWGRFPRTLTTCILDAHHRFIPQDCVRGFANFGESYKLFNPQPGQDRLAIDDSAVVSVYVRVLEDPTGLLWDTSVR